MRSSLLLLNHLVESDDEHKKAFNCRYKQKGHENKVVFVADTVVHPGTVVVVALNTLAANSAVARSWSPYDLTLWAEQHWV